MESFLSLLVTHEGGMQCIVYQMYYLQVYAANVYAVSFSYNSVITCWLQLLRMKEVPFLFQKIRTES